MTNNKIKEINGYELEKESINIIIQLLLKDYKTYKKTSIQAITIKNSIYKLICEVIHRNFAVIASNKSGLILEGSLCYFVDIHNNIKIYF